MKAVPTLNRFVELVFQVMSGSGTRQNQQADSLLSLFSHSRSLEMCPV